MPINSEISNVNIPQETQFEENDLTPSGDDLTLKAAYEYNQKTYKQTQEEQLMNIIKRRINKRRKSSLKIKSKIGS